MHFFLNTLNLFQVGKFSVFLLKKKKFSKKYNKHIHQTNLFEVDKFSVFLSKTNSNPVKNLVYWKLMFNSNILNINKCSINIFLYSVIYVFN